MIILSNNLINLACFCFCVRAARLSETQENDFHAQDVSQDARLTDIEQTRALTFK